MKITKYSTKLMIFLHYGLNQELVRRTQTLPMKLFRNIFASMVLRSIEPNFSEIQEITASICVHNVHQLHRNNFKIKLETSSEVISSYCLIFIQGGGQLS